MRFTQRERSADVWFSVWEERAHSQATAPSTGRSARGEAWRAVLRRERAMGQQVIEIVLMGTAIGAAEADARFTRDLAPQFRLR